MALIDNLYDDPSARRQTRTELNQYGVVLRAHMTPARTGIEVPESWDFRKDDYNPLNEEPHIVFTDPKGEYHRLPNAQDLDAEKNERIAGDSALQGNIDAEATARANADITLQGNINAEAATRSNADAALGIRIDALMGALVYIGRIPLNTNQIDLGNGQINHLALTNRIIEITGYPPLRGHVLVDYQDDDWYYDGELWRDLGPSTVSQATNSTLGIVKGSTGNLMVSVDSGGEMTVNGLQSALDNKQGTLTPGAGVDITGNVISVIVDLSDISHRLDDLEEAVANGGGGHGNGNGGGGSGQFNPDIAYSSFTDERDGKVYKTVKIGAQWWMAENLNYDMAGSVCYDGIESNGLLYGRLYHNYGLSDACPSGWHIPSNVEWQSLITFVGGAGTGGNKLKSKVYWANNGNGTDDYGFSALPGGYHDSYNYSSIGSAAAFWCAGNGTAYLFMVEFGTSAAISYTGYVYASSQTQGSKFSVRCVRDT